MRRCLQLAANGLGNVAPNPMVGCVIVYEGKIIGEGYHQVFGGHHAEVNAIASVKDKSILNHAVLYVNLEPCNHYGKTPPCTNLIIQQKIKRVVVGCLDPFKEVRGAGIEKLKMAGAEVIVGILEEECKELNKRFFIQHLKNRPYIILKWAQTLDGFIDRDRRGNVLEDNWISNKTATQLVHKWRSEEQAILVGTNTVLNDNPLLTTREWPGKSPLRIIIDKENKLPYSLRVFNSEASTIILNENTNNKKENIEFVAIDFKNFFSSFANEMRKRNIQSVIVEGGKNTLSKFLANYYWDEARVIIGNKTFGKGLSAPIIENEPISKEAILDNILLTYKNKS
ncbi:MAG: bifunctional diaminohydroxyphosphoribosylaminopyrimidine deaminase/5-amino-6-(5-phosphoribosylamino)uracil reductase RibD [Flavobacteriales bacterium]|nr:bifunctional diaminohydroxyphosphoribosylaminopyrimidine deaminase/5-amino-6-(5-phosphoribosylamino)uracil reductase RibD [Flavobacteriales bacterium]